MKFKQFASYLERLEKTSSRIEITKILAELFKKADANEIDKIVYLSLGELAPSFQNVILNLAEKMMLRVFSKAYGKDVKEVTQIYKKAGDLGVVAERLNVKNVKKDLSVGEVYQKLLEVAKDGGEGSQERKVQKMSDLLKSVDAHSARYIARIPVGKLRLGFSDKTILDGLSWMQKGDKSSKADLDKAYQVLPDPGKLAKKVKTVGIKKAVEGTTPVVGIPTLTMLAQRLSSPEEMVKKMGEVSVEPKLDGLRLLIHFKKGKFVKAFTRNLNETSWMFPELKEIKEHIRADQAILDCEAVGLDEGTKKMANFQSTMTRRRKHKIEGTSKKVGIDFYIFDILKVNKVNCMNKLYLERRKIIKRVLLPGRFFKLVDYHLTNNTKEITSLYKENVKKGLEGIIVKKTNAKYVPGRTAFRWVKMKHEAGHESKLTDTIDAVVMGYSQGKGKRIGFGVGQFLVGVVDGEKIKTMSKIGTGLTDDQFRELKTRLTKLEVTKKPKEYVIHKNYIPDYWVAPSQVVEIAADEITKSPTHSAGLALRFPRLIKFRDDKGSGEATTVKELQYLFKMQKVV
ncbi:ATP-dependent DNA ligase [Patescibacteria group bacterium]